MRIDPPVSSSHRRLWLCAFEVARSAIHIFHESDTRGLLCEDDTGGSIRML